MDIFQLAGLTDDMMHLSHNAFFNFLQRVLNKELSDLFQVQGIREMSCLSSLTVDEIIQILNFDIPNLSDLKKSLGFVTTDGNFHLRLGFRNSLDRLLSLVRSKKTSMNNLELLNQQMETDICKKLTGLWRQAPSTSNDANVPILIPWVKNIFENLQKPKNKFGYDNHIQRFAILLLILGGRNCYEFLRLNLPAALPHISNIESLMRNQEMRMIEGEFRFYLLKEYSRSNNCNYVYVAEDSTSAICRVDYDVQTNSFIGFSLPLINGIPQSNYFRTENFEELKKWFNEIDKSNFINLHVVQSVVLSAPPLILSAYGSNNKAQAIDIVKKWLFIHKQCQMQHVRVIGFSTDADPRYLRAMRLCMRFFAELPNLNLFRQNDILEIKVPKQWTWFLMKEQQILLFMQDPIHIATKFRNRLLSNVARMKMGSHSIDDQHLSDLLESYSKIEHNLIQSDINPKDRQNFASCLRISSEVALNLLEKTENTKGTYVYLSLLRLIISGFMDKSATIEQRLADIWTVVFTCRMWWGWVQYLETADITDDDDLGSMGKRKANSFITKPTLWCIEINAHTLLYIVLLVIQQKLPIDTLNTLMFNSQTCENTFRIARSLSGSFSTITNFSVKSFMKRCDKISILNSIKSRGGQAGDHRFQFPRHHKNDKETFNYSMDHIKRLNLNEQDVEKIIHRAFERAKTFVSMVNMSQRLINHGIYSLSDLSSFTKRNLSKSSSKIVDYTQIDSSDDDGEGEFEDNNIDSEPFNDDQTSPNVTDDEEEEENVLASDLSDTTRENFKGCRIYDRINPQHSEKYFRVRIGSSSKYIHKQTACWALTTSKNRLSSDRLIRVQKSGQK